MIFKHLNKLSCLVKFKLPFLDINDTEYANLSFGRRIEYTRSIEEWKKSAQSTYLSQKRQSWRTAIKDFVKLGNVVEYFCQFHSDTNVHDDSFEIWYKVNQNDTRTNCSDQEIATS